ncbi:MAG: hypothetical protein QXV69_06765 [Sulfolobaceae archaeon]
MERKSFKKLQDYILDFIESKNSDEKVYVMNCNDAKKLSKILLAIGQKPIIETLPTDECIVKVTKRL